MRAGRTARLSPPGSFAANCIGLNAGGKKCSKASHGVSTSRPTRCGCSVATSWQMAPPVSLPTSVTSVRSSLSISSASSRATARGLSSASGFIGRLCAPRGSSGTMQRASGASCGTTIAHSMPLASSPWTNKITGPSPPVSW